MSGKRTYARPALKVIGSVADLTRTGGTNAGGDGKLGSVSSQGN